MPEDIKKSVAEKVDALKKVKDGGDESTLKSASDELSHEMQKIGEAMMKGGQTPPGDSKPRDASYEEKKDEGEDKK